MATPDFDDEALLADLGIEPAKVKASTYTALEERLIEGFEDILRFVEAHGRVPQHGESRDIFERLYAVRLGRLRAMPQARQVLARMDNAGLLGESHAMSSSLSDELDDEALLAELGTHATPAEGDITRLRHVASHVERRAAEEIANRIRCGDFEKYEPLFDKVRRDLESNERRIVALDERSLDEIQQGTFFIIGGQMAYVAEEKDEFRTDYNRRDMRLRVIYENGTESDLLQRSLQRALHRDRVARLISDPVAGPLFGDTMGADDTESGTIYVLQSLSDHPFVAKHRDLVHKIGVTGGKVETRISAARDDPTYLLASVAIVATYKLAQINRAKLENIFHKIFAPAQLDLTIEDRFGKPVKPREWFLVPLQAIDDAVRRIRDGSITKFVYDPKSARLVLREQ